MFGYLAYDRLRWKSVIDKCCYSNYNYPREVYIKKMEQIESIPLSSLISGMLLKRRQVTSIEIANVISRFEENGIMIDDWDDGLEKLFCCVEMNSHYEFQLKEGFDYDSVLYSNVDVFQFLFLNTEEKVLVHMYGNWKYELNQSGYIASLEEDRECSFKFKKRILTRKTGSLNEFIFDNVMKRWRRGTILG